MVKPNRHHEFGGSAQEIEIGGNRSFGLVFCGFFVLLAVYSFWTSGRLWPVFLSVAGLFLILALFFERVLTVPNRLWAKFGILLGKIVSPIVLGAMFFLIITPFGVARRLLGADALRLRSDKAAESYWVIRNPPGPAPGSMSDQF